MKATLQSCISVISAVTWEQINQRVLRSAQQTKVERGMMLCIDSTVTESTIHALPEGCDRKAVCLVVEICQGQIDQGVQ